MTTKTDKKLTGQAYLKDKLAKLANLHKTDEQKAADRLRFEQLKAEQAARRAEAERNGHW